MREKMIMDGIWDFSFTGDVCPQFPLNLSEAMPVPGCFDLVEPYCGKRGYATCRRFVRIGGKVRLFIEGAGLSCKVFWDGRPVGEVQYAYMPGEFVFEAGPEGEHELAVILDNRHNQVFLPNFDFYGYGGIYGSVSLERIPENYIFDVMISTEDYEKGLVRVRAEAGDDYSGKVDLAFDSGDSVHLRFKSGRLDCELTVPDFRLWSPETPNLHRLVLRTETDEVAETFGIREFRADGRRLLLNGKPVKLIGYNRHESHPTFGAATPLPLMATDLRLLKAQGCNFVRGSHYPQRRSFLELCDRMGVLVWEETLGWDIQPPMLHSPEFLEQQRDQVKKLTRISFNHPCIIIRGFLNENESRKEETRPVIKALYDEIRAIDKHCLISFASNKYEKDVCMDFPDVIAMNPYPGWYDSTYDNISGIGNIKRVLHDLSESMPKDKPFLITEIGAEAIYGFRDPLKARWTEEYQAELMEQCCDYALSEEECAGIAIWQFADTRSYVTGPNIYARSRGFNNKGILDEFRRPKSAWDTISRLIKTAIHADHETTKQKINH